MSSMNAWLQGSNGSGSNTGSNQYMSYPNINPSQGPSSGQVPFNVSGGSGGAYDFIVGGSNKLPGGQSTTPTIDPALTQAFLSYLQNQIGSGTPAFMGSGTLPSGQQTSPGQLSADPNALLQQLMQMYSGGGSNIPGQNQLTQMAQTGDPIDQTPAWQAMIASQQQNIQRNQANLKEQFAFGGDLQSSPFGDAMQNYMAQTTADQNAQLTQATAAAQESAAGRELTAGQFLNTQSTGIAQYLQTLDQSSIDRMYQEFQTLLPQNNPLLQYMASLSAATPGSYQRTGAAQTFATTAGGIGSLLGGGSYSSGPNGSTTTIG